MTRPTVHDLAKAADVSLATIDRVLNARPGVSEMTIAKVNAAISQIGFSRNLAAAKLAKRSKYKFVFFLPSTRSSVIDLIDEAIQQITDLAEDDLIEILVEKAPIHAPEQFAAKLEALEIDNIDGVVVMAPESSSLISVLEEFQQNSIPVVAPISNLPSAPFVQFVGIDNVAAGRTAAVLMGRFLGSATGKILTITGSNEVRDHYDRRMGFEEVMNDRFPALDVLPPIEGWDDADRVEQLLVSTLQTEPDVLGIYSLGAGNRGLIRGLEKMGSASGLVVIAHELTKHSQTALLNGMFDAVIAQDIGHAVRSAIRTLKASLDHTNIIQSQEHIRIEVVLKENLSQLR